jgi:hypothetical protein
MNLNNIVLKGVVVVNTAAFHVRFSNVGNVTVSGCVMKSYGLSTDGLHFDGPANDIAISDCEFTTGDDSIALNCPEGYSGDISRVTVTNCKFNSLSLMRLYTTINGFYRFNIDSVSVSNCNGTLSEAAFLIGLGSGSNPNSIASLTISDCSVTSLTVLAVAENFGAIVLSNVTFTPSQSHVLWTPPQASRSCAFLRPSPLYGTVSFVGSNLTLNNCKIQRNSNLETFFLILENLSKITNLSFNGFSVEQSGGSPSMPVLLQLESGSIGQLLINSLSSNGIETPTDNFSSISSVAGGGVLKTGWKFPDAVMADETPYISASNGLPSIKINGVVEPYPLL